ncbi:hypothetical protein PPSIR1_02888 [Plesiocystis pacifica SIR-1]|uniref:Cytochrome c domain-containing protein n=2 Tax=Plesiocystis pacifica TaxID=191768 RepID=A6G948_9BACT|nr:hypothetical protein PPSIR1_02888 [Plesiocystis pacifica SIR-1]
MIMTEHAGAPMSTSSRTFLPTAILALALTPALWGCGLEPIDEGGDEGGDAIPAAVQQAFDESCATASSCHATGSALVVLSAGESENILSTNSVQTGEPYVSLGEVGDSYIATKILSGEMPPSEQSANDSVNTAIIVGWIAGVQVEGEGGGDTGETDSGEDTTDTGETGGGDCFVDSVSDSPVFTTDVWPTLEGRCALSGCHEALAPAMPDAAGAYANLVGVASGAGIPYVTVDSPDDSYLWHKVTGTHMFVGGFGSQMPIGGELCTTEAQAIYSWILQGAVE